jgi:hypothetical protein
VDCITLARTIAGTLEEVLDAEEFDLIPGDDGAFVDIATDTWTLRIEGSPVTSAWLSIDDEPDHPDHLAAARRTVMPLAIDRALASADEQLDAALAAALTASGDPLSVELAAAIRALVHPS